MFLEKNTHPEGQGLDPWNSFLCPARWGYSSLSTALWKRSWSELHCASAKATWSSSSSKAPCILSLWFPTRFSKIYIEPHWVGALLFCCSAPAWMIPDFPQFFKHIPWHSLAFTEKGELATSRAAAAPPRSEAAARPGFDVADLPRTGEGCCFSARLSPEAMNYPDNWLLTADTSPKGSVLLWEPALQGAAWMDSPRWKWGTRCLMNVSILLRDNHRPEGLSWSLKDWKCFDVRTQLVLWQNRSQLWNLETFPNFPNF